MCLRRDFFQCPINLKPILLVLARANMGWVWRHMQGIWEHRYKSGIFCGNVSPNSRYFYPTVEEVAADWGLNVKLMREIKRFTFITDASIGEPLSADRWRSHKRSSVSKLVMRWWMNWTFCRRKSQNGVAQDNCAYAL